MRFIKIFDNATNATVGEVQADNGKISLADPKLGYMVRWNAQKFVAHCKEKNWRWISKKAAPAVAARFTKFRSKLDDSAYREMTAIQRRAPHRKHRR